MGQEIPESNMFGEEPTKEFWDSIHLTQNPFSIRPETDYRIWSDRKELFDSWRENFAVFLSSNASRIFCVWGDYGAGKTHCFYHFKWRLEQSRLKVIYSRFPEGARNFTLLARQAIISQLDFEDLSRVASEFYIKNRKTKGEARARKMVHDCISKGWSDFTQIFLVLWADEERDELIRTDAKMWLLGNNLSKTELAHLGVSSNVKSDSEAIRLLTSIIRILVNDLNGYRGLVWMLDECEEIIKLSPKGFPSIQQGIRDCLDGTEKFCLTMAFTMTNPATIDNFLSGGLTSRLPPGKYLRIKKFNIPEAKQFIADILHHFRSKRSPNAFHPFDEDAVNAIINKIIEKDDLNPRTVLKHFERILIRFAGQPNHLRTISSEFASNVMEEIKQMDSRV